MASEKTIASDSTFGVDSLVFLPLKAPTLGRRRFQEVSSGSPVSALGDGGESVEESGVGVPADSVAQPFRVRAGEVWRPSFLGGGRTPAQIVLAGS
eukprot:8180479-Pyramimonas_sp.AAC.1